MKNELKKTFVAKDRSTVAIRPATINDASHIVAKAKQIVGEGIFIQKERVRTVSEEKNFIFQMSDKDNMYVVIELEGQIIGIARLIRGELEMKRHVGLFRTWIAKEAQGKGIGSKVMEYTQMWAKHHKLHKITLTVFSSNKIAVKLYEKFGFMVEGVQKDQLFINDQYEDEVFMAYFTN